MGGLEETPQPREKSQKHFWLFLFRILGGSCKHEWILEETGDETIDESDIASCMETVDDEKGKDWVTNYYKTKEIR